MIHVYDTSSVAGKKAFHAGKEFFEFLKCDVGADNSGVSCMYLDRISVCIYIKNTSDRNLYRVRSETSSIYLEFCDCLTCMVERILHSFSG